jgi:hypothetical protein
MRLNLRRWHRAHVEHKPNKVSDANAARLQSRTEAYNHWIEILETNAEVFEDFMELCQGIYGMRRTMITKELNTKRVDIVLQNYCLADQIVPQMVVRDSFIFAMVSREAPGSKSPCYAGRYVPDEATTKSETAAEQIRRVSSAKGFNRKTLDAQPFQNPKMIESGRAANIEYMHQDRVIGLSLGCGGELGPCIPNRTFNFVCNDGVMSMVANEDWVDAKKQRHRVSIPFSFVSFC